MELKDIKPEHRMAMAPLLKEWDRAATMCAKAQHGADMRAALNKVSRLEEQMNEILKPYGIQWSVYNAMLVLEEGP